MLLAQTEQELKARRSAVGGLLMDVKFESVEGLLEQAQDRKGWSKAVRQLLPETEKCKQNKVLLEKLQKEVEEIIRNMGKQFWLRKRL
jgi:hypothetical protein